MLTEEPPMLARLPRRVTATRRAIVQALRRRLVVTTKLSLSAPYGTVGVAPSWLSRTFDA